MKHLKTYRIFESMQDGVTPEQRDLLNASCKIYTKNKQLVQPEDAWWVNPETGMVDVGGNFVLEKGWTRGLLGIKFGKIGGYFNVIEAGLEDPRELPREIGTHLNASGNKFRTLEGIGKVGKTVDLDNNLLVSLEGVTPETLGAVNSVGEALNALRSSDLSGNPVRSAFLRDDLIEVLQGKNTWTSIYLSIVAGEYSLKKNSDESIEWIVKNKLNPENLGEEIKKAPEKMAVELAKVPRHLRVHLDKILDQIDLPPGFRENEDLLAVLGDVGL
jgi:hypothetical protein